MHLSGLVRLIFLWGAVCLLAGCAAEAPPRPPRVQRPEKVDDLTVTQIGRTLRLRFETPVRAMDGRTLTKPLGVNFYRQATPLGQAPPKAFVAVKHWISIPPQDLHRYQQGPQITYDADLSSQEFARSVGEALSFSVETLTRGFRGRERLSDPSNVVRIQLINVSPPVQNVRAVQIPQAVEVGWTPPSQSLAGGPLAPLVSYRIYRSEKPHPDSFAQEAETSGPSYRDTKFQYNQTYFYKVRAVFVQNGYTAQTADSTLATVTPHDIFPPAPPRGLTAVYTGRAIQLVWKPDLAPGVAGYNVYRQQPGHPPRRMSRELLRTPVFTDSGIAPGVQYIYWVTAVDFAGNESSPSQKATAATR